MRAREVATDIQERIAEAEQARTKLYGELNDGSLAHAYEEAARAFDGLGVEALRDDVPMLCRTKLMESSLNEVTRGDAVCRTCPCCHRILVVHEEDDAS